MLDYFCTSSTVLSVSYQKEKVLKQIHSSFCTYGYRQESGIKLVLVSSIKKKKEEKQGFNLNLGFLLAEAG